MNWKRIIGWSLLMLLAANLIGLLSGFIMASSEIDVATIDQAVRNHRLFRRIAMATVAVFCYWRLGAGASTNPGAHVFAAFVVVQLADMGLALALGAPIAELLEPWATLRAVGYALAGYTLAKLMPSKSSKPTPPLGSA